MKTPATARKKMGGKTPALVFPWKGLDGPKLPKWAAVAIVGCVFAFCLGSIRVQIVRPSPWIERKATVMFVPPGPEGRMWALQAQEGGPFPSHFEPSDWAGAEAMEEVLRASLREPSVPYVPPLRDLPSQQPLAQVALSDPGRQVFPERAPPPSRSAQPSGGIPLEPFLYPLSGITPDEMPEALPVYKAPAGVSQTGVPWRFLLRLHPDGTVAESVSLVGPDAPGRTALEAWLRTVRFSADPEAGSRWISLGIGFTNLTEDGPKPR